MGSELVSHVDDPEVDPTCPLPNFGGAAKVPFEELDGIPIILVEGRGVEERHCFLPGGGYRRSEGQFFCLFCCKRRFLF